MVATQYQGTAEEMLALDTFVKLMRATGSVKARVDRSKFGRDLSDSQFGVLEALLHLGPLHQNEVGTKLIISKSNVVAVIDKLEARGLVKRQRSTEDRRYIYIHLTEQGRETITALFPFHVAAIVRSLHYLSADEQAQLGRLCRKLGLGEE